MTLCTASAEHKVNCFIEAESYFFHFKLRGLRKGRDNTTVLLITEMSEDFPSKSDSPATTV